MKLPYVIDNREHTLANVLGALLRDDPVHALDGATAYSNFGAFDLLRAGLEWRASLCLLLGAEPGGWPSPKPACITISHRIPCGYD